jgi:protein disulfide-isomerase A6
VLDSIVTKFRGGTSLSEAAEEAKKEAKSLQEQGQYKYAEYYLRVFEKLGNSNGYAAKELARLDGIIKKGGLAPTKLDELTSKANILRRFAAKVFSDGNKEEL